jgi:trans-2,3-dihydro-3-hydroxyanthranilate isomerase
VIRYEVVDMFADRAFTGCGVGVVPDASTLSDEQMLAVAREVNQTETAFVLPSSGPAASYRVRVFTPAGESPFGGHSSLGTAVTLVRLGLIPSGRVVQQCGAALLPLSVTGDRGVITSSAPVVSTAVDATVLLDVCGLTEADLADAEPRAAGFGAAFHYLPVLDDSVAKAEPRFPDFRAAGLKDVFAFAWDPVTRSAHSRMFAPGYGMPEDPACASAALGLGVWLVDAGWLPADDGRHEFVVRQGIEMGRPSTSTCAVDVRDGRAHAASVGGRVIPVARGELVRP